jgi:hypothetical protein
VVYIARESSRSGGGVSNATSGGKVWRNLPCQREVETNPNWTFTFTLACSETDDQLGFY